MSCLLLALAVWVLGGCLALLVGRHAKLASRWGAFTGVAAGALAVVPAVQVLVGGGSSELHCAWQVPLGSLRLGLDPLSAVFLLVIGVICGLASLYGYGYLSPYAGRKNLGVSWCCFHGLAASMALVVTARNGLLFLVAWELMSLVSFLLVLFEDEQASVRRAGWTYLVASHLGTAFLLALFVLLGRGGDSLDFDLFAAQPEAAGALFLLAIVGFGTKAGFIPLHVWLPEAHPAAPSHVSAVMSGVMIKLGIYGLLRTLTFLGPPPAWWGWLLVIVGASSGVLGVLFALAQQDLKRLLAYSSVENIGIIALGLGVGLLGISYGQGTLAALGFAGGLVHVVNHALFKSLLFLGAGAVAHATGTREIDRLGGLLKRLPIVGTTFLIGAAAICGLPPLNGFVSELLVYVAGFRGLLLGPTQPLAAGASLLVIGALALIGGLAAACFSKAFGIIFLGEPRSPDAQHAVEHGLSMRLALVALAAACVLGGLLGPWLPALVGPAVMPFIPPEQVAAASDGLAFGKTTLLGAGCGSLVLVVLVVGLAVLRVRLLAGREVRSSVTWDCGYAAPTPRMQYTASSFAQPIVDLFRGVLGTQSHLHAPEGLFPPQAEFHSETPDVFQQQLFGPLFAALQGLALRLRGLQRGRLQLHVLYIAVVLVVLFVWKLR